MGIYMTLMGLGGFLGLAIGGIFSALALNGLVLGTVILALAGLAAVATLPEVGLASGQRTGHNGGNDKYGTGTIQTHYGGTDG